MRCQIVRRVTFVSPVESVGPDQLSEIKDIPVEGDNEVWANRAEDRSVFISADVEADVKLEDEHDADVWGGCVGAVRVMENDKLRKRLVEERKI